MEKTVSGSQLFQALQQLIKTQTWEPFPEIPIQGTMCSNLSQIHRLLVLMVQESNLENSWRRYYGKPGCWKDWKAGGEGDNRG